MSPPSIGRLPIGTLPPAALPEPEPRAKHGDASSSDGPPH